MPTLVLSFISNTIQDQVDPNTTNWAFGHLVVRSAAWQVEKFPIKNKNLNLPRWFGNRLPIGWQPVEAISD